MFWIELFIVFLTSFGINLIFTPLYIKLAKRYELLDVPYKRKIHDRPIPTMGGLLIFFSFTTGIFTAQKLSPAFFLDFLPFDWGIFMGGLIIIILGGLHDTINISPRIKLSGQALAGLILFFSGIRIEFITNPLGGSIKLISPFSFIITIIWIIAMINAINLIDGLDGLAAGLTIISSSVLLSIALLKHDIILIFITISLIASLLGFLAYNFHPAKIFMGDTGSMFLGFILSIISILGINKMATTVALLIPIAAMGIPIYDTLLSIVRRITKKHNIFSPDRKHLHHRLLDLGITHRHAVLFLYLVGIYFAIISYLFVLIPIEYAFMLLILLALGVFMGMKAIGFIEKRIKLIHKIENKR